MLLHAGELRSDPRVSSVVDELVANRTMVIVVASRFRKTDAALRLSRAQMEAESPRIALMSARLLNRGLLCVRRPDGDSANALHFSVDLASLLGVRKLVVIDERGGLSDRIGESSFVNATRLGRLCRDGSPRGDWSAGELRALWEGIKAGVESTNLATPEGLARELFTFEGSGTLITADEYCRFGRLGVEDFEDALRLLERGEREGFLLSRSERQRFELLHCAHGVWFEHRRLAGVAGLRTAPYTSQGLGEIAGLYTISRFQGEGLGRRLLGHVVGEARRRGLVALFACTSSDRAAGFFQCNGFDRVAAERVPAKKWAGRGGPRPQVYWRAL